MTKTNYNYTSDIIGKTIEEVIEDSLLLILKFTDSTYTTIESSTDHDGWVDSVFVGGEVQYHRDQLQAGLITEETFDKLCKLEEEEELKRVESDVDYKKYQLQQAELRLEQVLKERGVCNV